MANYSHSIFVLYPGYTAPFGNGNGIDYLHLLLCLGKKMEDLI